MNNNGSQSFQQAVGELRSGNIAQAIDRCRQALAINPGAVPFLQLLGHCLTITHSYQEAEHCLQTGLSLAPLHPPLLDELGSLYAQTQRMDQAIEAFEKAVEIAPNGRTYKKLASALQAAGRDAEAEQAFEHYLSLDPLAGLVAEAAELWRQGQFEQALPKLKQVLQEAPENLDAMRYLALVYQGLNRQLDDAEALLRNVLRLAPDYQQARVNLGNLLLDRHKWKDAIKVYEQLTKDKPDDYLVWASLGHAYTREGDIDSGLRCYEQAITRNPDAAGVHMSRAHLLKTLGRQEDSIAAYRQATQLKPALGEAYWSLANLKTFRFQPDEIQRMEQQLKDVALADSAQVHFRFALGKAYEDARQYDQAWQHYHAGNQLQRSLVEYDPVEHELLLDQMKEVFTPALVSNLSGQGSEREDPIFIVGLPRSGSTLIEQILASHSMVEGTEELHYIGSIAHSTGQYRQDKLGYPATLAQLTARDLKAFAQQYLKQTQHYRVQGRPLFIDKMPNNFVHVGFIKLLFPNAKIINTRRFPLDSLLGAYKQLFAKGQNFTYDMLELSEYYRSYVAIMDFWHEQFPDQILDVHYELHMDDFEGQVRRILDYCRLPFEEQCLRFYETERAVRTASSEQVRQPIYRSALGLWKHYEQHLDLWQQDMQQIIAGLPEQVKHLAG